jgi:PAS domain-containing protein
MTHAPIAAWLVDLGGIVHYGNPARLEIVGKTAEGCLGRLLTRVIHLKDDQGKVIRMVGSHLDITSMVTLQTALKTSEIQLSSVLSGSLDGIMAFRSVRDEAGEIFDFEWLLSNPKACKLVGRSPSPASRQVCDKFPIQQGLYANHACRNKGSSHLFSANASARTAPLWSEALRRFLLRDAGINTLYIRKADTTTFNCHSAVFREMGHRELL